MLMAGALLRGHRGARVLLCHPASAARPQVLTFTATQRKGDRADPHVRAPRRFQGCPGSGKSSFLEGSLEDRVLGGDGACGTLLCHQLLSFVGR